MTPRPVPTKARVLLALCVYIIIWAALSYGPGWIRGMG